MSQYKLCLYLVHVLESNRVNDVCKRNDKKVKRELKQVYFCECSYDIIYITNSYIENKQFIFH